VIRDSEGMQSIMDEISHMGGLIEPRGSVDGHPYFLIHWPKAGAESITRRDTPS
jgi:hypothetical protein